VHGTLSGRGVGVCTDLHQVPLSSQVQAMFDNAVRTVARLGAEVRHLSMRHGDAIHPAFTVIQHAEALRTHREAGLYPQYRDEYGDDVRGRLEHAERVTLRDYLQATVVREQARASIGALFREVDVLLTPVAAGSPARMGDDWVEHAGRTIEFRELVMTYTTPQDLVGIPACTVRAGFDELGIPIGVQFSGPPGADFAVLAAAEAYFQATPKLQARKPDLAS
jgi:aspartyl-tRNA(Asn)/glutamyl-tRNA(Gln) amidotransferase subunit A